MSRLPAGRRHAVRFMLNGKAREMGLGSFTKVGLADARKKAMDARLLLSDGHDPLTHRQQEPDRSTAAYTVLRYQMPISRLR